MSDIEKDTPEQPTENPEATEQEQEQEQENTGGGQSLAGDFVNDDGTLIDFSTGEKPEALPDEFWDAENNVPNTQAIYEKYLEEQKRAAGLRKTLSGKPSGEVPESPEGYAMPEIEDYEYTEADNVILGAIAKKLHENEVPADLAASILPSIIQGVLDLSESGAMDELTAQKKADDDEAEKARKAEEIEKLGANGHAVVRNSYLWVKGLESKGVLTPEAAAHIDSTLLATAEGVKALRSLQMAFDGDAVSSELIADTTGNRTLEEFQKDVASEKFTTDSKFRDKILKEMNDRTAAGLPIS